MKMKKLIDFFKKSSTIQIAVILLIISGIIVYVMTKYIDNPIDPVTKLVSNKVTSFKDKLGENREKVETNKSNVIVGVDPDEYNRTLKALGIKEKEVLALTNIQAVMKDSLSLVKLSLDAEKNKQWEWETKKPSGSIIKSTMSEKDSILHSEIDIKLNSTDYVDKGGLFKKDKYYTDFYSPDQNIKVNGAHTFRKETFIRPKRLGIGLQAGYGLTQDLKPSMFIGIGVSYNFVNF